MNIVLIEPDIHWNTGNIGRTCVATGSALHLAGKLGFSLDDKQIRRSGLDYWPKLKLEVHEDPKIFLGSLAPEAPVFFFSTKARKSFWDAPFTQDSWLVFGSETRGFPEWIHESYADKMYRIPTTGDVRSLNLSTAAAVVLYEALRRSGKLI